MFRLSAEVLGSPATAVLDPYLVGNYSTAWTIGGHAIVDLSTGDDYGEYGLSWVTKAVVLGPDRADLR